MHHEDRLITWNTFLKFFSNVPEPEPSVQEESTNEVEVPEPDEEDYFFDMMNKKTSV